MKGNNYLKDIRRKETYYYWLYLINEKIELDTIFDEMNIDSFYVYAAGANGKRIYKELRNKERIISFIDRDIKKQHEGYCDKKIVSIDEVIDDWRPIIITSLGYYYDVVKELIGKGIAKERLISLRTVLKLGLEYKCYSNKLPRWCYNTSSLKNQFLITGAGFTNKGAQAMLFVAVNEIRRHFGNDAIIYYATKAIRTNYTDEIRKKYNFIFLIDEYAEDSLLYELFPNLTAIVDISGYALSSNWNCETYLRVLRMAKKYDVPIFLMPQSYGPFEFEKETLMDIKEYLKHAKIVYVREETTYEWLYNEFGLKNMEYSDDLVLQSRDIDKKNILKKYHSSILDLPTVNKEDSVAIIPNIRNFTFGDEKQILNLYKIIIDLLLERGKKVYVLCHSNDEEVCEKIISMYQNEDNLFYINQELDCLDFKNFIKDFKFVIGSRYHSLVQAYKQGVPSIGIGWSEKYIELAKKMNQEKYVFDVRKKLNVLKVKEAILSLESFIEEEKRKIRNSLELIYKKNCFKCLDIIKESKEKKDGDKK